MRLIFFIIFLLISACTTLHPERMNLSLAPNTLGKNISLQQHLTVERGGHTNQLDTVLEINSNHLNLVGLMFGHRIMTIYYDGKTMKTWRDPRMPSQVTGENVLEDIELTLWPVDVLRKSLPAGWTIEEKNNPKQRLIYLNNKLVVDITYFGNHKVILNNLRYRYQLTIQSAAN